MNLLDLLLQIVVSAMLFASVFLVLWSVFRFPAQTEPPVHRRIALAMGAGQRNTMFEMPAMASVMSLALTVAQRFSINAIRERIRIDLDASGNRDGYSVDEYIAICLVSCVVVTIIGSIFAALLNFLDPLTVAASGVVGFGLPLWLLHSAAQARVMRISKRMPYSLDLVALTMSAGSTFSEALNAIIRDDPNDDLNQELSIVMAEIDLGSTRAVALSNLAERIPLDALRSVVGAVNQAEALGTPLASILKSQSSMLRMTRSVRAEKLSASASLRILIPSMLILMAVILIVFAPALITWAIKGTMAP